MLHHRKGSRLHVYRFVACCERHPSRPPLHILPGYCETVYRMGCLLWDNRFRRLLPTDLSAIQYKMFPLTFKKATTLKTPGLTRLQKRRRKLDDQEN